MRRKGGFTLVELLIVIVIIGILAGMALMTMGSATDSAEATKVVNDLATLKRIALQYYNDWKIWPATANTANVISMEAYLDRALFSGASPRYGTTILYSAQDYAPTGGGPATRRNIGVNLPANGPASTQGVQDKLAGMARDSGLLAGPDSDAIYTGGTAVYMNMK